MGGVGIASTRGGFAPTVGQPTPPHPITNGVRGGVGLGGGFVGGSGLVEGHGLVGGAGHFGGHGLVGGQGLIGGHGLVGGAGLVGGHGLVRGHGLVGGHGLIGGHGFVGGAGIVGGHGVVGDHGVVGVGAGQVSHQSVSKPLQGENRGVTQSKAFGSSVAAVSDHPSSLHGAHANRIGSVLTTGVIGHEVGHGLVGGVGHGLVGGVGHGVVGGFNGYTGFNGVYFTG